jgi:hypothetical protein
VYHVELRQFPHNMCRFNLTDAELRAIVDPWVGQQVVEFGERKWRPEQAKITIFDGPSMPLEQLTMGRGWRAVERQGENVTDAFLAAARKAMAAAPAVAAPAAPAEPPAEVALAEPLTLGVPADLGSLASLLGEEPARLLEAWREVSARSTGLSPSERLALAERQLRG